MRLLLDALRAALACALDPEDGWAALRSPRSQARAEAAREGARAAPGR